VKRHPPVTFTFTLTHPPTCTFPTVAHCLAWSPTQPLTFQRRLPVAPSPHLTSPHLTPPPATQRGNHRCNQPTNQPFSFLLSPFFLCLVFVCLFVRSFIPSSFSALVCYEYCLASLTGCDGLSDLLSLLCRPTSRPRTLHTSVCVDCVSRNNWSFLEGWLNLDQQGVDKRLRMKLTTPA